MTGLSREGWCHLVDGIQVAVLAGTPEGCAAAVRACLAHADLTETQFIVLKDVLRRVFATAWGRRADAFAGDVAALGDPAELLGMLDRRLLTDQGPPGQGRPGTRVAPDAQASGLTRWANAVARVIDLADDPTTLDEWASAMGASTATVKGWCRTTRLRPKPSLDLARVLRAANLSLARGRPIDRFLAAADRRTLARLLAGAGLTGNQPVRSLTELLRRQRFIQDEAALSELTRAVIERGPMAEQPPRG